MELAQILVTTDFSDHARAAYPAATSLASKYNAAVHVAHVVDSLPPFFHMNYEGLGTEVPDEDYFEESDRQIRDEVNHTAFRNLPAEPKPHLLHDGQPHDVLRALCQKQSIDLMIVATHGHTGFGHALLGSFAQKVVRHASVPVLVFRERQGTTSPFIPKEVLVPFDFSENSRAVFPSVRILAKDYGSRFTFLYVLESIPAVVSMTPGGVFYDSFWQAARDAASKAEEQFARLRAEEIPDVDARLETADGVPYLKIVDRARELNTDLVLMTTHGWTGLKHFFLGSVAEKVIRKSPCSVLTIGPPEEPSIH